MIFKLTIVAVLIDMEKNVVIHVIVTIFSISQLAIVQIAHI